MKKFILICCCERDIEEPKIFNSYEEAYANMKNDFLQTVGLEEDALDDDNFLCDMEAYCTNLNNDNVDWKIFEIKV